MIFKLYHSAVKPNKIDPYTDIFLSVILNLHPYLAVGLDYPVVRSILLTHNHTCTWFCWLQESSSGLSSSSSSFKGPTLLAHLPAVLLSYIRHQSLISNLMTNREGVETVFNIFHVVIVVCKCLDVVEWTKL